MRGLGLRACSPVTSAAPPTIQNMIQPRKASREISRFTPTEGSKIGAAGACPVESTFALLTAEVSVAIVRSTISELQLETKLYVARATGAGNDAGGAGTNGGARSTEVGVIEYVEKLSSELEIYPFSDRVTFDDREIPILHTGADQDVPARVSEARRAISQGGGESVGGKAIDIEPHGNGLGTGAIANAVRTRRP